MKILKNLWEKLVINRYVSIGLRWGDATSYLPIMGKADGYDRMEESLIFWERKYANLGYIPLSWEIWVSAGGYGRQYEHYLRMKK
jgi:hypothetical protein